CARGGGPCEPRATETLLFSRLKQRIISLAAALWMRRLRYPWSRVRRVFERRHRDVALPVVHSIEDVREALSQITWTRDGLFHLYDSVSRPETTWAKKRDDCDGFAALASELLHRLDPRLSPVMVTVVLRPLRKSHTVCAFRPLDSNELRVFDNSRLVDETFPSLQAVVDYVARR